MSHPLVRPAEAPSRLVPARPRVEGDLPCARCGYDLRTLPCDGVCPECALSIRESIVPVGFRIVARGEARTLCRRLTLVVAAVFFEAMAYLFFFSWCRYAFPFWAAGWTRLFSAWWECVWATLVLSDIAIAVAPMGVVLAWRRASHGIGPTRSRRLTLVLVTVGAVFVGVYHVILHWRWRLSIPGDPISATLLAMAAAAGPAALVCMCFYILALIDRRGQPWLWRAWIGCVPFALGAGLGRAGLHFADACVSLWCPPGGGAMSYLNDTAFDIAEFSQWWETNIGYACWVVLLLAIALLAHRLRAAPLAADHAQSP